MGTSKSAGIGRGRKGQPKPSLAQRRRREDRVVLLSNLGFWPDQIASSLDPPVSETTVTIDRQARKSDLISYGRGRARGPRPWPPPEKFDWMAEPPAPPPKPAYWSTGPLLRLKSLLDYLRSNNARGAFAFNLDEAKANGDAEFFQEASETIADLTGRLAEFGEMMASDEAKAAAKTREAREDLREPEAESRTWHGPPDSIKPMPVFGRGVVPPRYHAALWQEWYAGHDIFDPKVLTRVATGQRVSPARVRLAADELAPLLRMWELSMGQRRPA